MHYTAAEDAAARISLERIREQFERLHPTIIKDGIEFANAHAFGAWLTLLQARHTPSQPTAFSMNSFSERDASSVGAVSQIPSTTTSHNSRKRGRKDSKGRDKLRNRIQTLGAIQRRTHPEHIKESDLFMNKEFVRSFADMHQTETNIWTDATMQSLGYAAMASALVLALAECGVMLYTSP